MATASRKTAGGEVPLLWAGTPDFDALATKGGNLEVAEWEAVFKYLDEHKGHGMMIEVAVGTADAAVKAASGSIRCGGDAVLARCRRAVGAGTEIRLRRVQHCHIITAPHLAGISVIKNNIPANVLIINKCASVVVTRVK